MYNLFRFFVRYHLFIIFVLLEVFCFYLIYSNSQYQKASFISTANNLSGKVYSTYSGITDYLYLRDINDSLARENASLHGQLLESKTDNVVLGGVVSDSSKRSVQVFSFITARVIRNTVNRTSNIIYLNKGKLQGVEKQMGVIAPNGIVGQVINVTDNYSAVMSLLSKDFKVSARFKKNEYFGNLHWEGINTTSARLEEIPKHVPVKVGDTLVTSGFSQLFPRNVMIGTVQKVNAEPDKTFLDVTVRLSTGFGNLSYVYVVNNMRKTELQLLDSLSKVND